MTSRSFAEKAVTFAYWRLANLRRRIIPFDADMEPAFRDVYRVCRPYTMTRVERMYALWSAVRYVIAAGVPGDFVECGVWRGGSMMLIALTLEQLGVRDRRLHLLDTFEGMPEPAAVDRPLAARLDTVRAWTRGRRRSHNEWLYAPLDEVRRNMARTGFPDDQVEYVKGMVEETLPAAAPTSIALLRLDTDFYSSTLHELETLYPRLVSGGVLVIDDYGYWRGSREATDQYLASANLKLLLLKVDAEARFVIKP